MRRGLRTEEEVRRAFNRKCDHRCPTCERRCTAASGYSHRFDCCGVVVAHVMQDPPNGDLYVGVIRNPNAAGYVTGPSQTVRSS